jgi:hypothetical protein
MADSRAWLTQANSDLEAARLLRDVDRPILYCQVAAKCQQVVEKSVKAIATELNDRRIVFLTIGFDHRIEQYIEAIRRAPGKRKGSVPDYIKSTLSHNLPTVTELMSLAPHKPADIDRLPKNTEYPFGKAGARVAPADTAVFLQVDVDRYLTTAGALLEKAQTLIAVTERGPR